MPDSIVGNTTEMSEQELWRATYAIAYLGASNPKGVKRTLDQARATFGDHPAVRCIQGHLDYLNGKAVGPDDDDFDVLIREAKSRGLGR